MTVHEAVKLLALICLGLAAVPNVVRVSWVSLGWLGLFLWLLASYV